MYYIRKHADCWAIHNYKSGQSRALTEQEKEIAILEFPELKKELTRTVFSDEIKGIPEKP